MTAAELPEFVMVDLGYETNENWERAKVIRSTTSVPLFEGEDTTQLLVELVSGERIWVSWWKPDEEIPTMENQ